MKKVKRYNENGYVTSDDSNSGMKEARDLIDADIARTPSSDYGDYMPESSSQTMVATSKPKSKPKAMAKTTLKTSDYSNEGRSTPAPAAKPDVTKMSLSERMKASRESARSGVGTTDTRSVSQRLRSAFGMASGGTASSRADGIASRGKTRGKMC
jgi:hypothetical protein